MPQGKINKEVYRRKLKEACNKKMSPYPKGNQNSNFFFMDFHTIGIFELHNFQGHGNYEIPSTQVGLLETQLLS